MSGANGGRPRKPLALKVLEGTARKDRTNPRAPKPKIVEGFPPAPADLTKSEKQGWKMLADVVKPLRVVTPADMVAFRQMAISLAMIDQARRELKKAGGETSYSVFTESGEVIRSRPQVETIAKFQKILGSQLADFGLTPADREKVSALNGDQEKDPLDEFSIGGGSAA